MDALLAPVGDRLVNVVSLTGGPMNVRIETERCPGMKGKRKILMASYCPFCGEKLNET